VKKRKGSIPEKKHQKKGLRCRRLVPKKTARNIKTDRGGGAETSRCGDKQELQRSFGFSGKGGGLQAWEGKGRRIEAGRRERESERANMRDDFGGEWRSSTLL